MDIYERIDELLQKKKLSRRKLAAIAEIPPTTLQSAFGRNSKGLSFDHLQKIANALGVSADYLLGKDYFDIKAGEIEIQRLHDGVKLIDAVQNQHGETAAKAMGLLIELNPTGQEKAMDYISDLFEQRKYKK